MRSRLLVVLGVGLAAVAGCCGPSGQRTVALLPQPGAQQCNHCGTAGPMPPRYQPFVAPAPGLSATLGTPTLPPSQDAAYVPPVPGDPQISRFAPDNGARPGLPINPTPSEAPSAKLMPPLSIPSKPNSDVPAPKPNSDLLPMDKPTAEPPLAAPAFPADIPQYAIVKKGVASGQQPFPDGIKWLKDNGYKTVLHIRQPGKPDTAAKDVFENRGFRYVLLEVSPTTLTKDVVDQFNKIVGDETNRPLFVFDRQSALAGALWYLHFRTVEGMSDEKARAESARLGFKQDQDDNHREMWIAVQSYLKNQNP